VNLLKRFMSDRAKIRSRRVTGNDTQQQREIAKAIKNAREMALLPYASRVTQQRGGRSDRGERSRLSNEPMPTPSAPPPGRGGAEDEGDEFIDETGEFVDGLGDDLADDLGDEGEDEA